MHNYSHKTSKRNPQEPTMIGKLKPQKTMSSLTTAVLGEEEGTNLVGGLGGARRHRDNTLGSKKLKRRD